MGKYSSDGIHKGTWVAVHYDPMMSQRPSYIAQRYNRTIHRVSKVVNYGGWGTYFELENVVSEKGVPYGFTIDEIEKVDM